MNTKSSSRGEERPRRAGAPRPLTAAVLLLAMAAAAPAWARQQTQPQAQQQQGPPVLSRTPDAAKTPAAGAPAPAPQAQQQQSQQQQGPPVLSRTPEAAKAPAAAPAPPPEPSSGQGVTITNYDLNLTFNFPQHELATVAKVDLTALSPVTSVTFALNPNLKVASVEDASGQALSTQRTSQGVAVTFAAPLQQGATTSLTFHYSGILATAEMSPIAGIRTAYVGPDGAFLLYPGEWFPMLGYGTDRFTMTVSAALPPQFGLVASGMPTATPQANGTVLYRYEQRESSFPGTVIVTQLRPTTLRAGGLTANFYFNPDVPADLTQQYGQAAGRIYDFLTQRFGAGPVSTLHFIELPDDSLPSLSAPNMILLSKSSIGTTLNYRLLMDEIAQQWFGMMVSPATLNDAWLEYGAARFCEGLYVQQVAGNAAYQNVIEEFMVGALSYPDVALANTASLYAFSPQFQDLTYDKGAMLFHMLRWVLGDQRLFAGMRDFLAAYRGRPATTEQFEAVLEKSSGSDLRSFFSEWYRSTGVPTFSDEYVIYRLGDIAQAADAPRRQSGQPAAGTPTFSSRPHYRVTGKLHQPLDLFSMPVELRIETDGATETKRVMVEGTDSDYSFETEARPRKITIDPDNWLLKETPEMTVKVDIARGDNDVAAGDFAGALKQYQAALAANPISSLAHYRMAEAYYLQQNWQQAANEYRAAIDGDAQPAWVVVWSHIQLGKIFDLTGQRDRAINEYQLAIQTHDNTQNAQVLARQYLQKPYQKAANTSSH
ncbi:MAG TPA: M1 family aminopeptidase [Terriglobales bacterium]|nr:M1 family aminopeptidase [Terriglobales bacterium]